MDYSWKLALVQGVCLVVASYFFQAPPSTTGIAVTMLGVVAIVMAVRAEDNWSRTERALWLMLAVLLAFIEIRSINQDTFKRQSEEASRRRAEEANFEKILDQNSKQFDAMLGRTQVIMGGIASNISAVTGGESYVIVVPILVSVKGPNTFPLAATLGKNKEKNRLSDVRIVLRQLPIAEESAGAMLSSLVAGPEPGLIYSGVIDPFITQVLSASITPSPSGESAYFINVFAANKSTIETLRVRLNPTTKRWQYSFVIKREIGSSSPAKPAKYQVLEETSPTWREFRVR